VYILICLVAGAAGAYFCQPFVDPNSDAVLIVITVFTVFAGFLVAIITIVGDPALLPNGSWRTAEARRDNIERRLIWHSWLFTAYLVTIALLFVGVVLAKVPLSTEHRWMKDSIEYGYLFFGITSFLFSFALPWAFMTIQRNRVDAEIDRRRREVDAPTPGNGTS
jgi:hypothetical protein